MEVFIIENVLELLLCDMFEQYISFNINIEVIEIIIIIGWSMR
ncbi:hypothetical protein EHF_0100 [Ehrlichia japonica]|uniref:Uncharacterized protein n=1 Tax=Ehrlichia japonica TaxID=391036 RepID=X5GCL4_9RICK|nr:hypothetical protein EHF_0100 [Ehrlichia japonica]